MAGIVIGSVFVSKGFKGDEKGHRNLTYIKTGWIIIGTTCAALTAGLAVLITLMGGMGSILGWIIVITPFIIIGGLIVTLALGVDALTKGYTRPRKINLITRGWVLIGINLAVVTTIIVLLVMFTTGIIPIRLM